MMMVIILIHERVLQNERMALHGQDEARKTRPTLSTNHTTRSLEKPRPSLLRLPSSSKEPTDHGKTTVSIAHSSIESRDHFAASIIHTMHLSSWVKVSEWPSTIPTSSRQSKSYIHSPRWPNTEKETKFLEWEEKQNRFFWRDWPWWVPSMIHFAERPTNPIWIERQKV